MCAILLVAVGIVIFWIFKYDDWYPNPVIDSHIPSQSQSVDTGDEAMEVGAESYFN